MKVLHLDSGCDVRGGQKQLLLLYRGLERLGFQQMALCRGPLLDLLPGREITPLAVARAAVAADVIHAHDSRSHTLAALFGGRKPIAVARRTAFPAGRGALSRWKYRRAAKYIAVSRHVAGLLEAAGTPSERIAVVPDGVAVPGSLPPPGPPEPPRQFLVLDSPDPLKCRGLALKACSAAGVQALISNDIERDLPRADGLLYLTESEGLGSAILLAGAWRKPIVATRTGGIPEIVEHESTGLLVSNTVEDAAAALRRFIADPALARNCAEAARRQAMEQFRADTMVERTAQVYRSLVAAGPRRA